MAPRPRFFSRRVILQLISATPAAVVASTAVVDEATAQACENLPPEAGRKFSKVARELWTLFVKGTTLGTGGAVKIEPELAVFQKGMDLSGMFVLATLNVFDKDGKHAEVGRCCVACGWAAAERARQENPANPVITPEIFEAAWCDTQACFRNLSSIPDCKRECIDPEPPVKPPPPV